MPAFVTQILLLSGQNSSLCLMCPIWSWHCSFQSCGAEGTHSQECSECRDGNCSAVNSGLIPELSHSRLFKLTMHPSSIPKALPTPLELIIKTRGILDYLKSYERSCGHIFTSDSFKELQLKQFMGAFCPVQPLHEPELFSSVFTFGSQMMLLLWGSSRVSASQILLDTS